MNFLPLAALATLGYLAYSYYSKPAEGAAPPKSDDTPKPTQPVEGPLPLGVRYQKTDKGTDYAVFDPKYRDTVLFGLTGQINEDLPTSKEGEGPFALRERPLTWITSSFLDARDASLDGKWVLVPQTLALRYVNEEDVKPEEALILYVTDETSLSMYSKSGWAVVASPGSLKWAEGMSNAGAVDKLSTAVDFTPTGGWSVRSTPAAMDPTALLTLYGQHLAAKNSGAKENLTLSFAIRKDDTDTSAAGNLAAMMTLEDGVRKYPVVAIDQGAYPAPVPGTPFLVPETSVIFARRIPG